LCRDFFDIERNRDSKDDLNNLNKYLGIEEIESLRGRPDDLYKLYYDVGANRTHAIFYAFRNYLGKLDTKNIS